MKEKTQDPLEALSDIRNMMERSSKFVALSGKAGIFAGIFTLVGAIAGYFMLDIQADELSNYQFLFLADGSFDAQHFNTLLLLLGAIFVASVTTACLLAAQNAKKRGMAVWDATTRRVVFHFAVPLVTGALFSLALLHHHSIDLIAPTTLIFYGLSHVNMSKYTLDEIRTFGIIHILLGLIGAMHVNLGIQLWVIGFGLFHILYGAFIYFKYEK
jgi:hypothetical protein